jgi:hypothetical protein
MRQLLTWAAAAVLPALLLGALSIGCGGPEKTEDAGKPDTKKPAGKGKLEPVASTGTATLKGKVTLAGAKPDLKPLDEQVLKQMEAKAEDKDACLTTAPEDQKNQQKWRINKDGGVENVFVWLAPPDKDHFFKVDLDKATFPKEVVIDQPHCAFIPHAAVLFTATPDPAKPKELKPTGQKFIVKNSAKINHNTAVKGGENKIIPSGGQITPELEPEAGPVELHCNIHPWMNAVVRVLDHPYATVTDKDGNFEIKNAPAGAKVRVIVWHEVALYGNKGQEGEEVTLEADKTTTKDYSISK